MPEKSKSVIKLTKEDLNDLSQIENTTNDLLRELGRVTFNELELKNRKDQIRSQLDETSSLYRLLLKQLESRYGVGRIDMKTGTFTPA